MESCFFKSLIEFVIVVLLFYDLFFWPRGMWDLGSLTRDCTCSCPLEGKVLTTDQASPPECVFQLSFASPSNIQFCRGMGCCCYLVTKLYPTLCDPMDCSPLGSSVHGIFQARILEWVAIPFPRGSSRSRN